MSRAGRRAALAAAAIALVLAVVGALLFGRYPSPGFTDPRSLFSDDLAARLMVLVRLPRVLSALLLGAALGAEAIPAEWCDRLCEWPRSVNWMMRLAERLSDATSANVADAAPLPLFWPGLIVRNLCFGVIVLLHALRRMFPPYAT